MIKNLSRAPRLYVQDPLFVKNQIGLGADHAHYLGRVLRLQVGDSVRIFNGNDGEFLCEIIQIAKRACVIECKEQSAPQDQLPDIEYLFAPLKTARLDYMAQKATEMGAAVLCPVITEYTQNRRLKLDRLIANTIEAAEQCNLMSIPQVCEPQKLNTVLTDWDKSRQLIFCDESAKQSNAIDDLVSLRGKPVALLIGPEGGFSPDEREILLSKPYVTAISLGPRILRADTAGVAALAVLQTVVGDW